MHDSARSCAITIVRESIERNHTGYPSSLTFTHYAQTNVEAVAPHSFGIPDSAHMGSRIIFLTRNLDSTETDNSYLLICVVCFAFRY